MIFDAMITGAITGLGAGFGTAIGTYFSNKLVIEHLKTVEDKLKELKK